MARAMAAALKGGVAVSGPTKSRILGGLTHWQGQQIVRIDREPTHPIG